MGENANYDVAKPKFDMLLNKDYDNDDDLTLQSNHSKGSKTGKSRKSIFKRGSTSTMVFGKRAMSQTMVLAEK